MHNKDLGSTNSRSFFSYKMILVRTHFADLKTQLLNDPLIESVAAAGNPIGNNDIGSNSF